MEIFWMIYYEESVCCKKGFLQGSVNYHMNDVLARQEDEEM